MNNEYLLYQEKSLGMLAFEFLRWSSWTKTSSSFNMDLQDNIKVIYINKNNRRFQTCSKQGMRQEYNIKEATIGIYQHQRSNLGWAITTWTTSEFIRPRTSNTVPTLISFRKRGAREIPMDQQVTGPVRLPIVINQISNINELCVSFWFQQSK